MDWGYSDTDTSSTNNPSSRDECLTMSPSLSSEMSASDSDPPPKTDISPPESIQETKSKLKSRILPKSLLDSVTEKIRDGIVPQADIVKSPCNFNDNFCIGEEHQLTNTTCFLEDETVSLTFCPKTFIDKQEAENITVVPEGEVLTSSECNDSVTKQTVIDEESGTLTFNNLSDENSILTVFSDEETRTKKQNKNSFKQIPNYFISIQFSDTEINTNLKDVQKSVMKKNGNYSLAVVPLHSLHMTLAVMHLGGDDDIDRARAALDRSGVKLTPKYEKEMLKLPLQGLGNFRNSVVFAKVQPGDHVAKLEEIAEEIQAQFFAEGLVGKQSNFTPHVTVMKLSRVGKKLTKKTGLKKIYPDVYDEFIDSYFGCQPVGSIQLCSMLKQKGISGYYHIEHEIYFGTSSKNGTKNSNAAPESVSENQMKLGSTSKPSPDNECEKATDISEKTNSTSDEAVNHADEMNSSSTSTLKPDSSHSVIGSQSQLDTESTCPAEIVTVIEPLVVAEISPISVSEPRSPCKSFVDVIEEGLELAEEAIEYVNKGSSLPRASSPSESLPNPDPHETNIQISGNEGSSPLTKKLKKTPNCNIM
uniref:A-kinase anchor protein 7-like phosphoesterase domain-containing protein n=2 Tax=Octopus bimaculoides TaxID=37653 RepID=A0A0L8FJR9_OCTBM